MVSKTENTTIHLARVLEVKAITYVVTHTVGLAQASAQTISGNAPRLLVIAGATGVGKSMLSVRLAHESKFSRLLSTDAIREIMRICDKEQSNSALQRSSFSKGDSGEPVIDWLETCNAIEPGIEATIARARGEGIDLLIEGVHIVPSDRLLRAWRDSGGIAVGLVMCVDDENEHQKLLKNRDAHTYRRADRYLASFSRIRKIQDGLIEKAKIANWPVVDQTRVKDDVKKIQHLLDLAWNESKK